MTRRKLLQSRRTIPTSVSNRRNDCRFVEKYAKYLSNCFFQREKRNGESGGEMSWHFWYRKMTSHVYLFATHKFSQPTSLWWWSGFFGKRFDWLASIQDDGAGVIQSVIAMPNPIENQPVSIFYLDCGRWNKILRYYSIWSEERGSVSKRLVERGTSTIRGWIGLSWNQRIPWHRHYPYRTWPIISITLVNIL